MSKSHTIYEILIASPSDLKDERKAAAEAIADWNSLHSRDMQVTLQPRMYEKDATPEFGDHPQTIINKQLVAHADLVLVFFWTRLGTKTEKAESGTVEEINEAVAAGKDVMVYFSDRKASISDIDPKQLQRRNKYKKDISDKALLGSFDTPEGLKSTLKDDLTKRVRMMIANAAAKEQAEAAQRQEAAAAIAANEARTDADKVRMNKIADEHNDFIQRVRDGKFHKLQLQRAVVAMSIISLKGPASQVDLKTQNYQIRNHMRHLTETGAGFDTFPGVGAIVSTGKFVDANYKLTDKIQTVTEVTDKGHYYSAAIFPVVTFENGRRSSVFGLYEGKMMHAGGEAVRMMMQAFGFESPFMVGIALLEVEDVNLLPNNSFGRDARAVTENNITPDQGSVEITCAPADYSATVMQFTAGVRPIFDRIWQHAGQFSDPHYDENGNFSGY